MSKWNKDTIIEAIRLFVKERGRPPKTTDFKNSGGKYPSYRTVQRQFGSWNKAIKAAGFEPNKKPWTDDEIIEAIQLFVKEHGKVPLMTDFLKSDGKYPSHTTVIKQFDSWNKAIEAAGFSPNQKIWTKDTSIKAIRLFVEEHGRVPVRRDFRKSGGKFPSFTTVQKQFGSWNKAIEAAGFSPNQKRKSWTDDEIIQSIKLFVEEHGRVPLMTDFQNSGGQYPSASTVQRYFSSWNDAIEAAGFKPNQIKKEWTNDETIESIQLFVGEHGRVPQEIDFQKSNGKYPSFRTVQKQFDSWNKAIEAAGFEADYNNGFGTRTKGKDGRLYRSKAEAYFADNFLFGQYKYDKEEPKYPKPYNNLRYDWYLYELDCYIELDGGIRPDVIPKKIEINKDLGRNLLVIPAKDIYKKDFTLNIKDVSKGLATQTRSANLLKL